MIYLSIELLAKVEEIHPMDKDVKSSWGWTLKLRMITKIVKKRSEALILWIIRCSKILMITVDLICQ